MRSNKGIITYKINNERKTRKKKTLRIYKSERGFQFFFDQRKIIKQT
jgi:hypothetical protein